MMPFDPVPFDPMTAVPTDSAFDPSSAAPVADDAPTTPVASGHIGDFSPATQSVRGDPVALQNFMRGAAGAVTNTSQGIHQIAMEIGHHLGLVSDEDLQQEQAKVDALKQSEAPLMATTAGKVGNVVGTAAPALLLPEAGIAGSALEGGLLGATQPVATGESRLQNAGLGAIGGGAGGAAGKVISGVLGGLGGSGGRQAAVDLLDKEGIPVSAAQATGSKLAQTVERASGITSGAPADFAGEQAAAFNRAVLRRVGVTDPKVTAATPDVLGPAKDAMTSTMDAVASRTRPRADDIFLDGLADVEQSATRQLPASDIAPIRQNLNDILQNASENNGYLDGTFVQKLNANLGALSRNPATAPIASDLRDVVNDVIHRYATPGDAELLSTVRPQYRALKQIEPAIDPATGNISVLKLMNSLNSKAFGGRNQTLYGKGDQSLIDLAKAAKSVIPDNLGNSGTAERAIPLATALDVAASGEPVKAGLKAAAGTLGLNAAGKAMRNQGMIGAAVKSGVPAAVGIPGGRAAGALVSRAAMPLGAGTALSQPRENAPQYASGGRVSSHEDLVQKLMSRWHAARKQAKETTKPLLNVPDETIRRALELTATRDHPG
jgi:hypothetical protein